MNELNKAIVAKVTACGFTARESLYNQGRWYLFNGDGSHSSQLVCRNEDGSGVPMGPIEIAAYCDGVLWAREQTVKKLAKVIERGFDVPNQD